MPLRKIWNALRGTHGEGTPPAAGVPRSADAPVADHSAADRLTAEHPSADHSAATSRAADPNRADSATGGPKKVRLPRSLPLGRRSKAGESRLVQAISSHTTPANLTTILEIGVGDGSRAVDVVTHLQGVKSTLRYVAIDQFEAGGGATKLMDFHRTLRSAGIRPQVFPDQTATAISQVGRTVGAVDLILISASYCGDISGIEDSMRRIAHPETVVLVGENDQWSAHRLGPTMLTSPSWRSAA